jgi:two-component system response regulator YesN
VANLDRTTFFRSYRKLFSNLLVSIFFCIAITLLISSTILYFNFEGIALDQVYRSDLNSLNQTSREVDDINEIAKSLTFQIENDQSLSKLLYYQDSDVYDEASAMLQLRNYRLSMPFIESVYVYNGHSETFYISSSSQRNGFQTMNNLDDQDILNVLNNYQDFMPYVPIPRAYTVGDSQVATNSYTYLGYDIFSNGDKLSAAVIVNISEAWLNKNIGDPTDDTGYTFFMDNEGKLLSGDIGKPLAHLPYIKNLLELSNSSGFFIDSVNGMKSLVSYTAPNELGWTYVRVTPYKLITSKITAMRLQTIIISLSILLLGIILSFIISKKLYSPIDKIIRKMTTLEAEKRNHQQVLKQEFLRNMILGRELVCHPKLQEKLKYYEVNIDVQHAFRLILFRIDRYTEFYDKYNTDEQRLMKFAIQNISSEICKPDGRMESVDMGEDCILLLFNINDNQIYTDLNENAYLVKKMMDIQSAVSTYLKLSVSMTISSVRHNGMEQVKQLYKQVHEASFHRLFHGSGCLLHVEPIMEMKWKNYTYPISKEKQLIEFVMTNKVEESKKLLSSILDETGKFSYTVVQLAISHLSLTVNNMLHEIQTNNSFIIESELDTTILQHTESLDEVKETFYLLFEEVGRKLDEKRKLKHDDLSRSINEWIEQEYANPDLNLNSISSKLGMTPAYISRLYKQFTLNSLTDVINDVRMNKAKELLLHTAIPITEIATKTGFTTVSYFFRMFKRNFSVTPTDYRKMHRNPITSTNNQDTK